MASAERIYGKGSPNGRKGRRHVQDVVYQFHYRQEPFLRRVLCRAEATRVDSLHTQIRWRETTRRNADDDNAQQSILRDGVEHCARGRAWRHTGGGVLSWLARVADAAGQGR